MVNIIYIHGFRSAGRGGKYDRLKRRFRKGFKVMSPTFSDNVAEARKKLHRLMRSPDVRSAERTVVFGTSLGGFYSYYLSVLYDLKSILINPVMDPSEHMKKYVNRVQKNFRTGKDFRFSRKDIDELSSMEREIEEKSFGWHKKKVLTVIGERDTVINRTVIEAKFGNILFMDDGHEFNECFDRLISMPGVRDFITL